MTNGNSTAGTAAAPLGRWGTVCLGLVLGAHAGLLAWGASRQAPTYDEVGHLPAGLSHWSLGRFELYCVNPPLVRSWAALPVVTAGCQTDWRRWDDRPGHRPEIWVGQDFFRANGPRAFWLLSLARWACVPLSLLGGYLCFRWARELYGGKAGLVAAGLWAFSPNVLAHAQLITPDAGAAAVGLAAAYLYWRWLRSPRWPRAAAAGAVLGLALLTKFTWLVLLPLAPLVWLLVGVGGRRTAPEWYRQTLQLALLLLTALYGLNLGYGLARTGTRLGEFDFVSRRLRGGAAEELGPAYRTGNRFRGTWLAAVPMPVPGPVLVGLDLQQRDLENELTPRLSYLRGRSRLGGWWYYYLYALGVKEPLGLWLLAAAAVVARFRGPAVAGSWRDEAVLLLPATAVFVAVSAHTGFNQHFRYVLPALPFLLVAVSRAGTLIGRRRPVATALVGASLLWYVASSLSHCPYSLSYFNELAGGPAAGHAHLIDSNIDWGQDLHELKRWAERHPEARPLWVDCYSALTPEAFGIGDARPPEEVWVQEVPGGPLAFTPKPGWYAISAHQLRSQGVRLRGGTVTEPVYRGLIGRAPGAVLGRSIYLYHLRPKGRE
jgi:hypothetical protein